MKSLYICLFCCLGAVAGWGQPINKATTGKLIQAAELAMENDNYYYALEKYQEAYDETKDRELLPVMADLYYQLRDTRRAERYYALMLRRDDEGKYAEKRFEYARCLKMNEDYREAIEAFEKFIAETGDARRKELAQAELTGAQMALELPETTKGVTVESAGTRLNTPSSEYSPVLNRTADRMYFSMINTKEVIYVEDENNQKQYAKIYQANKNDRGWGAASELDEKINRPGFHNSNVHVSPDGNTLFLTRAQLEGHELAQSKIYYSVGGDGNWRGPEEVIGVNGDWIAKHPAAGELFGQEVLFFVSDMDGGYGGFDIYYATRKGEGVYGDPVNLGPRINTVGNESSPYFRDGTLYFSSEGHPGLGGYDIFYTTWDGAGWSDPAHMGRGYNSSQDDRFFTLDEDGYYGLLASNRPGGRSIFSRTCCDDIYTVEIAKIYADLVVGVFTADKEVLKGATVELLSTQNDQPRTVSNETSEAGNRFDFDLELDMPYRVIASRKGYYPDTVQFNTVGLSESKSYVHRFYLEPIPQPDPEPQFDTITIEEPIVLENILYEFDSDRIQDEAEADLEVVYNLMTDYPEMVIELRSHTDYRGDDLYNKNLSQRRAESARRWLMRKGVERERIEARGYGETVPQTVSPQVARRYEFLKEGDVLTPGYIDSLPNEEQRETAHQINRRTEFKILEGPTTIVIDRKLLRKNEEKQVPDKQRLIREPDSNSLQIHKLSSLHGKTNLKGVPVMQFEERSVDLGTVKQGEQRQHRYEFVNRGDAPLKIAIVSACDCTTVDYPARAFKPGERGALEVVFDSSEKEEAETINIDIILENTYPPGAEDGEPIIETIQYTFDIQ